MIAKVIPPKRRARTQAPRFAARLRYVCGKAAAVEMGNLVGPWPRAAEQMRIVAAASTRVRQPCHHMVLSWGDGEAPSDADALTAGRMVLRQMGWQDHQHVLAVHRDRPNLHLHMVLNRVHPRTGRACALSHDYARLEHACRRVERAFGWPPDRGRFRPEVRDGVLTLRPMAQAHWQARVAAREMGLRPDPPSVRGPERRSGTAPLRDRLPAPILSQARRLLADVVSWIGLHSGLHALGLRYLRQGGGGRVTEIGGRGAMPACHLGAAFALPRLVARFGRFRPAPPARDVPPTRSPGEEALRQAHDRARADRRERRDDLDRQHRAQRGRLNDALRGIDPVIAAAFRMVLTADQRAARRAFSAVPLPRLGDHPVMTPDAGAEVSRDGRHRSLRRGCEGGPIPPMDHTRARQLWGLAGARAAGDALTDLRRIAGDRLLLARRGPNDAVLGHDLITETPDGRLISTPLSGPVHALGLIGPRRARHCLVTADAASGAMLAAARPEALVIVAAPGPSPRLARWLRRLVGRRAVSIACAAGAEDGAALQACLPQARMIDPAAPSQVPPRPPRDAFPVEAEHDPPSPDESEDDFPAPSP